MKKFLATLNALLIGIIMMFSTNISANAYYAYVSENANMRDDYYELIYNIPEGSSVNVIGEYPYDATRTSIEYNGRRGHVLTTVLQANAKVDSYNANNTYSAYIVENANMRDDSYELIYNIPAWSMVEVICPYQYDSSRTLIKYNGRIGHILSSVINGESANAYTSVPFECYYACNIYSLNMRDTLGNLICKIPANEYMYVTGNCSTDTSRAVVTYNGMTGSVLKAGLQQIQDAVFVSTTNQTVSLFVNSQLLYTSDCVTGRSGMDTPVGIHYIYSMEKNRNLIGYNPDGTIYCSFVNYWMPFCGDIGLHDATWRSSFGIGSYMYSASYGCVNLPLWMAAAIYENAYVDMPVYVS